MKKIIIILVSIVILFLGYGFFSSSGAISIEEIIFEKGIWPTQKWGEPELMLDKDCIPDEYCAINFAQSIISNYQKEGYFKNYVPQSVFLDTTDNVWVVTFSENNKYPQSCVYVAIKKANAEVLSVWVGE